MELRRTSISLVTLAWLIVFTTSYANDSLPSQDWKTRAHTDILKGIAYGVTGGVVGNVCFYKMMKNQHQNSKTASAATTGTFWAISQAYSKSNDELRWQSVALQTTAAVIFYCASLVGIDALIQNLPKVSRSPNPDL